MSTRRIGRDAGTTIVEMMVAVSVFLVVSAALFDAVTSFQRNDKRNEQVTQVRGYMRAAMDSIGRDVRAATTITPLASSVLFTNQLDIVNLAADGITTQNLRWRLDGSNNLVRETLSSPGGTVTASRVVLASAGGGAALLQYFDSTGIELVPGVTSAVNLSTCTARVRVNLSVTAGVNRPRTTMTTDIALRNRIPGTLGC